MKKEIIEERRARFLENLLQEAIINVLAEQAAAEPAPAPEPEPEAPSMEDTSADAAEGDNKEFTIEEMIERLNVIRGGKSFKDNDVYTKLVVFFSKLSDEQKAMMRQMLIDIGQVVINAPEEEVAGEVPASEPPAETAPFAAPAPAPAAPAPMPAAAPATAAPPATPAPAV